MICMKQLRENQLFKPNRKNVLFIIFDSLTKKYPKHKKIEKVLKKTNQTAFFTTEKDWVKLPQDFIEKYDGCYIKMEISIKDESFYTLINKSV